MRSLQSCLQFKVFTTLTFTSNCNASAISCTVTRFSTFPTVVTDSRFAAPTLARSHRYCFNVRRWNSRVRKSSRPKCKILQPLRARVMSITSVLKSCHSFSRSAFIMRCDASSLSPSPFKTIPTFIADDTVSLVLFHLTEEITCDVGPHQFTQDSPLTCFSASDPISPPTSARL